MRSLSVLQIMKGFQTSIKSNKMSYQINYQNSFNVPTTAYPRIEAYGNIAYIAGGSSGLSIVNIEDPMNPYVLSTFTSIPYPNMVYLCEALANNKFILVTSTDGSGYWVILKINVSNPLSPYLVDTSPLGFYSSIRTKLIGTKNICFC